MLFDQTKFDYLNDNGNLRIMMVMPLSEYCAMTGEKVELSGQEMLLGTGRNSYKYSNMKLMDQVYKDKGKVRAFRRKWSGEFECSGFLYGGACR